MKILVRRSGALGDVLDVTPVTRRLRLEHPDAQIDIATHYPEVFHNSPDRVGMYRSGGEYDRFIDLDMVYENLLRKVRPVEAHMRHVFGDDKGPFELVLERGPAPAGGLDWSRVVVMHPARSWPQRTLPWAFWTDLASELIGKGYIVVVTGTAQDWPIACTIDTRGQLALHQQAAIIHAARCFVGSDSGLACGLAWTTDAPIVALLTMAAPWFIDHPRHGEWGWRHHPIVADIECVGCQHDMSEPTTSFACRRGDNACVQRFDPIKVAEVIDNAARQ